MISHSQIQLAFLLLCTSYVVSGASDSLRQLKRGTNATYVAVAPQPPTIADATVSDHTLRAATVDYKNAVIAESNEKIWVKQLHYVRDGEVMVHRSNFSEIWEDTENNWICIRTDTTTTTRAAETGRDASTARGAGEGGGVCLLLPLAPSSSSSQAQSQSGREGQRHRFGLGRRRAAARRMRRSSDNTDALTAQHAAFSLATLDSGSGGISTGGDHETFVALRGPLADPGDDIIGARIQRLCRDLDLYIVEKIERQGHEHRERNTRRVFKAAMRVFGWLWNNRRILGVPFGVRGPIYVR